MPLFLCATTTIRVRRSIFALTPTSPRPCPSKTGPPNSFINSTGDAHVTIVSDGRVVLADFDSGQIYVYYDLGNASVGFGSTAGKTVILSPRGEAIQE